MTFTVNGREYRSIRLLGKGKGGYSYLVTDGAGEYVLKQLHHEPCAYFTFGDKMEAELSSYRRLTELGIRVPRLLAYDRAAERLVKEYIDGPLISELTKTDAVDARSFAQLREMCAVLYPAGINIDYYPTNFIVRDGLLYYIDYECSEYSDEWNFDNWGIKYWSKTLETERLLLRRFFPRDLQDLYEYLSDAETLRFEPYRPMTLGETKENLAWRVSTPQMIAVEQKETRKLIGNLWFGLGEDSARELGYVLNRSYWRRGYAKEACEALIRDAFDGGLRRICAHCDPLNPASWRLLESLGFTREAYLPRNTWFWKDENGNPVWKDTYVYSLTNPAPRENGGQPNSIENTQ